MKKKIMIVLAIVAVLFGVIMMREVQTLTVTHMKMNSEVRVKDHVAKPRKSELSFVIENAGEYRLIAEWQTDKTGVQTGCFIADEKGNILYQIAAGSITVTSKPIWMEAGNYKIGIYYIGGSKQQLEFADMVGWEMDESEAIEWEERYGEDGTYYIDYDLKIEADIVGNLFIVVPFILIILVLAVCYGVFVLKGDDMKQNYDERQILIRGKGYEYAFCAMLACNSVGGILGMAGVKLPISGYEFMLISVMLGVLVYTVYSIWNEGYFALNMKIKSMIVTLALLGIINSIIGFGAMIQNGLSDIRYLNLLCGIMLLIICVVITIKMHCKDGEEE